MIIVKLIGGLGNQMFQYALGRRMSLLNRATLELNLENLQLSNKLKFKKAVLGFLNLKITEPRKYGLGVFNIEENFVNKKESRKLGLFSISEPGSPFCFHSEILQTKDDCCLSGFWQTEKYFKEIENIIRKDFTLKENFSIDELEIAKKIKTCNAVSLHVRRGDYVSKAAINRLHGTCSLEYYANAMDYINKKVSNPKLFVFSDDIKWARENLKLGDQAVFVSDEKLKDYEELVLMSLCKHHIIANSSFSWWGAWLNPGQEKVVITPKKWLADISIETHDLIPEGWIKL